MIIDYKQLLFRGLLSGYGISYMYNPRIPLAERQYLRCYRLDYRSSYDEEMIWALVQRHGGHISIRNDCIDFWIHESWEIVLNITFPDLVRRPDLDYVV